MFCQFRLSFIFHMVFLAFQYHQGWIIRWLFNSTQMDFNKPQNEISTSPNIKSIPVHEFV